MQSSLFFSSSRIPTCHGTRLKKSIKFIDALKHLSRAVKHQISRISVDTHTKNRISSIIPSHLYLTSIFVIVHQDPIRNGIVQYHRGSRCCIAAKKDRGAIHFLFYDIILCIPQGPTIGRWISPSLVICPYTSPASYRGRMSIIIRGNG